MTTYRETDRIVDRLVDEGKYADALSLLESAEKLFPADRYEIMWYRAVIHALCEEFDNCLDTLESMDRDGFFSDLSWPIFNPLRSDSRFMRIEDSSNRRRERAQRRSRMRLEVVLPSGSDGGDKHPGSRRLDATGDAPALFLALHGNGQSLDQFMHSWPAAPLTDLGFAVAYVQSSQVIRSGGYAWTGNLETARSDIRSAHEQVLDRHAIERSMVVIGGFSGGAIAALEIAASATVPVRGVVAICPSLRPESFTAENVELAARRGVRAVVLEGEETGMTPDGEELLVLMRRAGLEHRLHTMAGIGHAIPDDFADRMTDALSFILGDK